jgi:hypothetical protein
VHLELRNKVYAYCDTSALQTLVHKAISDNGPIGYRSYFHLCHFSYQIRREFLPLYYKAFTVRDAFKDVPNYLTTFISAHPGLHITGIMEIEIAGSEHTSTNLLPVIRIRDKHPGLIIGLKCCRDSHDPWDKSVPPHLRDLSHGVIACIQFQLEKIFRRSSESPNLDKKWPPYVEEAVEEMRIECNTWKGRYDWFGIHLVLKTDYVEAWMANMTLTDGKNSTRALLNDWIAKTGCSTSPDPIMSYKLRLSNRT